MVDLLLCVTFLAMLLLSSVLVLGMLMLRELVVAVLICLQPLMLLIWGFDSPVVDPVVLAEDCFEKNRSPYCD